MSLIKTVRNRTKSQYAANRIAGRFAPSQTTHAATVAGHNLVILDGRTVPAAGVAYADIGSPVAVVNAGSAGLAAYSAQGAGIAVQFAGGSGTGGTGGGMEVHDLNSVWHTGTLADAQAPQFLKYDGTRQLTGNLSVASGVTIDGVDLSAHAADPNAHHATATVGNGLSITGQLISLSTPGTLGVGTTNSASGAHTHALDSSSNPGATAKILASTTGGALTLEGLTVNGLATLKGVAAGLLLHDRADSADDTRRWAWFATGNNAYLWRNNVNEYRFGVGGALVTPASLTLQPASDLVIDPGTNLAKIASGVSFQSDNYASQITGMRVTYDGQGDFRYIYTDELHAKSFIADLEQALAGGQIISKSVAVLALAFTAPAASATTGLYVYDLPSAANMAVFQSGDIVRLRTFSRAAGSLTITDCWGTVTGYIDGTVENGIPGAQYWTFTRSAAPNSGAMAASTVIAPDALVLDYGTTGNGFHEVNAIDGAYAANSPYSQIATWTTHPATGQTVRVRTGNLFGIFSQANEYGLFAGTGSATADSWLRISSFGAELHNLPIKLYNGATQTVNLSSTGTDIWVGPSSADRRLQWDGTTLTVNGAINVTGGNAATTTYASTAASTAQTNAQSYTDSTAANKALSNVTRELVSTTLITGGNIRVGSGTKDSTLSGWHLDIGEIVGQAAGVDQVVLGTDGKIKAGAGAVTISRAGIAIESRTGSAFNPDPKNRIDFMFYGTTTSMGYIGASELLGSQYLEILQNATAGGGGANLKMEARSGASWPATIEIKAYNENTPTTRTLTWTATSTAPTFNGYAMWHEGNDGATSGLYAQYAATATDADTLDTYHASAFGRLAALQTWTDLNIFSKSNGIPISVLIDTSGLNKGIYVQATGALATSTNSDTFQIYHVANDVWAFQGNDATPAYINFALCPLGGNVGIGTGSNVPAYKLEVNGTVQLWGALTSGSAIGGAWAGMTTLGTNYTVSGHPAQSRRFGDITFLRGAIDPADDTSNLDLVQIATSTHRPARAIYLVATAKAAAPSTTRYAVHLIVHEDGIIEFIGNTSGIGLVSFDGLFFFNT